MTNKVLKKLREDLWNAAYPCPFRERIPILATIDPLND